MNLPLTAAPRRCLPDVVPSPPLASPLPSRPPDDMMMKEGWMNPLPGRPPGKVRHWMNECGSMSFTILLRGRAGRAKTETEARRDTGARKGQWIDYNSTQFWERVHRCEDPILPRSSFSCRSPWTTSSKRASSSPRSACSSAGLPSGSGTSPPCPSCTPPRAAGVGTSW